MELLNHPDNPNNFPRITVLSMAVSVPKNMRDLKFN